MGVLKLKLLRLNADVQRFRDLENDLQAGEQRVLFLFTFKEAGLYVFGLNTDPNKMLVLRIMESNRVCREDALLPQLRTADTLAALAARLPSALETGGWSLFISIVVAAAVMAVLVLVAIWTLKHQKLQNLALFSKLDRLKIVDQPLIEQRCVEVRLCILSPCAELSLLTLLDFASRRRHRLRYFLNAQQKPR